MASWKWTLALAAPWFAACTAPKPLTVQSHTVRDQLHEMHSGDPMAQNEKLRRLHGAVSMEERAKLLGQYFTIRWNDAAVTAGPAEVVFEYQQGATGSAVKSLREDFPAAATRGVAEFSVIGEDYTRNGKVLAWRVTLRRGGETLATRHSYLWQSSSSALAIRGGNS